MQEGAKLIRIKSIYSPELIPEGKGATVMRVLGDRAMKDDMDPFLMLDYFSGKLPGGFPDHPHRGFETVTYMQKGKMYHEDFLGNKGVIEPGDIQWMTAGRGIVHAEMPGSFEEESIGFQLWLNLKSTDKMQPPSYQEIKKDKLPVIEKDGVSVILIAGEALGQQGPIYTRTPAFYIDVKMQKNTKYQQLVPAGFNALAFVYEGEGFFGKNKQKAVAKQGIRLEKEQEADQLIIATEENNCSFILFAGKPIGEPVAQRGPFVMNTVKELQQTFDDYNNYKNGFENARNWESKIQYMSKGKK